MRTQYWLAALCLATSLSFACKREELEIDPALNAGPLTVGQGTVQGLNSANVAAEQKANLDRIADLDKAIAELNAKLNDSQGLSADEKSAIQKSLNAAEEERTEIIRKQKELEDKLKASEKALEDARKKNEELQRKLEESAGNKPGLPGRPEVPVDPRISRDALGPFAIQQLQKPGFTHCLVPADESSSEGAVIEFRPCIYSQAQQVILEKVKDAGNAAYRVIFSHSSKCLSASGDGSKIGDILVQRSCTRSSNLKEVFFFTGINDRGDFLLQPTTNGSLCFNVQADKTIAQGLCDDRSHIFQIFSIEE